MKNNRIYIIYIKETEKKTWEMILKKKKVNRTIGSKTIYSTTQTICHSRASKASRSLDRAISVGAIAGGRRSERSR